MELLTAQQVLTQVTGVAGNKEQNLFFPPYIFESAINLATQYLLNALANIYPNSQGIVDKMSPFVKRKILVVDNGLITKPSDYRNTLSVGIAVDKYKASPCDCVPEQTEERDCIDCLPNNELINTTNPNSILYDEELAGRIKEKCRFINVEQLDVDQFFQRSSSKLRPPTYEKPVYTFIQGDTLKICPTDINYVEMIYIRQPKYYTIPYIMMPDDTWQIDTSSPDYVPLEWEQNIAPEMFRAMTNLYAVHTRDGNLVNWQQALKQLF